MDISITLPDEIAQQIGSRWDDLPRRALEALIADAVRESLINGPQAQKTLGLSSRFELDGFLKRAGIYLDYTEVDLDTDIRALEELRNR